MSTVYPLTNNVAWPTKTLRPPEQVMRLERMGSFLCQQIEFYAHLVTHSGARQMEIRLPRQGTGR